MRLKASESKICVLTGAGISAESGIKTFRDAKGLWENHDIMEVASPEGYKSKPDVVQRFYNARRKQLHEVSPNAAHIALADLEKKSKKFTLITQNVDDLHERAGSKNILHMHGELRKIRHTQTDEVKYFEGEIEKKDYLIWRPDIVWFGENVKYTEEIYAAVSECNLFLCIGTSNQVYPAAGLVQLAKEAGAHCVELNLESTQLSSVYDEILLGEASLIVPRFIESLFPG